MTAPFTIAPHAPSWDITAPGAFPIWADVANSPTPTTVQTWTAYVLPTPAGGQNLTVLAVSWTDPSQVWSRRKASGSWIDLAPGYDWSKLVPPPAPTAVTAAAPTSDDTADTYTIPATTGVQYLVDGVVTAAGTVTVGDIDATYTVTAEALEGYVLEGTTSWTLTFTAAAV